MPLVLWQELNTLSFFRALRPPCPWYPRGHKLHTTRPPLEEERPGSGSPRRPGAYGLCLWFFHASASATLSLYHRRHQQQHRRAPGTLQAGQGRG